MQSPRQRWTQYGAGGRDCSLEVADSKEMAGHFLTDQKQGGAETYWRTDRL